VPDNNGVSYSVTIDDPTPLTLDTNATVDNLMIASGSSFTVSNTRNFTLVGDTGGGGTGMLMIDGLLTLGSTTIGATLSFDSGMSVITSSAPPVLGIPTLSSTTSSRNAVTGIGTTPILMLNRQNVKFTGTWSGFESLPVSDTYIGPNTGTTLTFSGIDEVTASNSEFRSSGDNTRFLYDGVDRLDGSGTSTMVAENGGTIEHNGGLVTQWSYDAIGNRSQIINRSTTLENNVYDIRDGATLAFEGLGGRVENNNQFTMSNTGETVFRNASEVVLAAGTVFFQDTGGVVRSLGTGNFTRQFVEGNGGDAVTFRSAALPISDVYSYDTSDRAGRNIIAGTGDTPRVVFENQRKRATGTIQDLDEVVYDNSRVEPHTGRTYAYDRLVRVEARNSEFRASGDGSRFAYDGVGVVDGTGTSSMVAEDGGTIEHNGGLVTQWTYDAIGNRSQIINRSTTLENNVYDIRDGATLAFEGLGGRVENNNQFTMSNTGETVFRNASEVVLAAGTVFFQDTGGVVRSLGTGNFTRQFVEGNGGDAVTFRSAALPVSDVYSYDTSDRAGRNIIAGTGDTPRVVFENQRKRATGTIQDLDEVLYDNSRVEPNAGGTYAYDGITRVVAQDSEFRSSGDNTRFLYDGVDRLDGSGTSSMVAENGGTIEQSGGTTTGWTYDVRGNFINAGVDYDNNVLDVGPGGVFAYDSIGNRLRRTNTVRVDAGQLQFRNASTTDVDDGTLFDISNGGRVATNGNIPTTVNFGGITADPVVFRSSTVLRDAPSITSSASQRNTWNGVGPAANLDHQQQLIIWTGTWQNFDNVLFTNSEVANNPGTGFVLDGVNRITARNSLIKSRGPGGEIRVVNAFFDGTDTSLIEVDDNATFDFTGGRSFDFRAMATNGSTIEFNGQILSSATIGSDETSRIILNNTAADKINIGGNTQVGGQFTLSGSENQFDALVTDPFQSTTVTLDGASLDAPLTFADRPGNALAGTGPIVINSDVAGAATLDGPVEIGASGSVIATGNNPIVFDQPGSVNNGVIEAAGGSVIVNEDITGAGRFGIGNDTTLGGLTVANGKNISADLINVVNGTFRLNGGVARANSILVEVGANLILASTLSTDRLTIGLTDESAWNPSATTIVQMTGGEGAAIGDWSDWGVLEIAGLDQGDDPTGFQDNFEIPILEIGPGASVFLRDFIDNGNRAGPGGESEALYVETLVFSDSFSRLNLNGLNLYFNELQGDTGQIINTVVPVPPAIWLFGSAIAGLAWLRRRRGAYGVG
jgi:hypothetical protein